MQRNWKIVHIYTYAEVKIGVIFPFSPLISIVPLTFSPSGVAEITYGNEEQSRATDSKKSFCSHM